MGRLEWDDRSPHRGHVGVKLLVELVIDLTADTDKALFDAAADPRVLHDQRSRNSQRGWGRR